jgi:hypothetical protein
LEDLDRKTIWGYCPFKNICLSTRAASGGGGGRSSVLM